MISCLREKKMNVRTQTTCTYLHSKKKKEMLHYKDLKKRRNQYYLTGSLKKTNKWHQLLS